MSESVWGFGIVRSQELSGSRALFDELCAATTKATGVRMAPFTATSYRELAEALERGEVGFAWMPPVPSVELEERRIASVLCVPSRHGSTSYHAALVVRRGGPKSLDELRGRRAAWVQRDSAAGYIVPRAHLAAQGFDVLRFFSREVFMHSHEAVVDAVASGEVDVGATFCAVDDRGKLLRASWMDADGQSARPVETIATMGPIPNDALLASMELPATTRASMTRWLLDLDAAGRDIFRRLLDAAEFRLAPPGHYDALRHALRAARARGYDSMPPPSRRLLVARPRKPGS